MDHQKTLNGKTDCRGAKGYAKIRISGNVERGAAKEILDGLRDLKREYPCIKITVNKTPIEDLENGMPLEEPREP